MHETFIYNNNQRIYIRDFITNRICILNSFYNICATGGLFLPGGAQIAVFLANHRYLKRLTGRFRLNEKHNKTKQKREKETVYLCGIVKNL